MTDTDEEKAGTDRADPDLAAATWFHRLAAARDREVQDAFQDWLAESPSHADAFARTTQIWSDVGEHGAAPEMMALREAAIADSRQAGLNRWRPQTPETRWPKFAAACFLVVSMAVGGYFFLKPQPAKIYATKIGERAAVTLADNSHVDIDADSTIAVDFSGGQRLVHLTRGEAFFHVAKDPSRPFIVEADGRRVVATGTQFNVERLGEGVQVTLVEGRVIVHPASETEPSLVLSPNDEWIDAAGTPPRLVHLASTLEATAWRQGKLLFNNETLSDAVARMNRHAPVRLVVDPAIAGLRIGGAFDAGDVAAFANAMKAYYGIAAVAVRPGELRLMKRS